MKALKHLAACLGLSALLLALLAPAASADFGILPGSFSAVAENEDGSTAVEAGSHPYAFKVKWAMNLDGAEKPEATMRSAIVKLPPGFIGNPQAVPSCPRANFEGGTPHCPAESQVGFVHVDEAALGPAEAPVYNVSAPSGRPAMLGLSVRNFNSFQEAMLRTGSDYGIDVDASVPTALGIQFVEETIWGMPMAESHTPERYCFDEDGIVITGGCKSTAEPSSFLSLPTSCTGPLSTTLEVESVEEPGARQKATYLSQDEEENPVGLSGCNQLDFSPSIEAKPTTNVADSPSGLEFNLHLPQSDDPNLKAEAHLKDTTITLPKGLTVNPASANGLGACSMAELGITTAVGETPVHTTADPATCPDAAKLGTVQVDTPLLKDPLPGAVYIATPYQNPFNSLLALYITVHDPVRGVVVKLAGEVKPDPVTGQLRATFENNPQVPFEDFHLSFFGGAGGSLRTPPTCGTYQATSVLTPWSSPEGADATPTDSFAIAQAPGGGSCPTSDAQRPNKPSFSAGALTPTAGAYSPFLFRLARQDGSQEVKGIEATLPKGLSGKLAGVSQCPEAQIAVAISRSAPGQGVLEQQSPSCPATSEVGTVKVGAGAGPAPYYAIGHAYLSGPYKGAPIGLAIITPAVAGPFDLGVVVARVALHVDPTTAQIHAVSDPLPTILEGIPLDVRSVALNLSRNQFSLNPTSCDPMAVLGTSTSLLGQSAALSSPFQVGECAKLPYAPKLSARLFGPTNRGAHPRLRIVLKAKPGEANSAAFSFTLPRSEFIDQAHFRTICTRVQFAAKQCPTGSIYGHVSAQSPLLDYPLEGPVYLRSSSHKLPDAVAALHGPPSQPIEVEAVARVDSIGGRLRSRIETVPDAPISKVVLNLQGGPKGLFQNSTNICKGSHRISASFRAQNGKRSDYRPLIANGCGGKGPH